MRVVTVAIIATALVAIVVLLPVNPDAGRVFVPPPLAPWERIAVLIPFVLTAGVLAVRVVSWCRHAWRRRRRRDRYILPRPR